SRKQQSVAHSTCELEYIVVAFVTKQYIWTQSVLQELLDPIILAVQLADSNSSIDLANNSNLNNASKHIDIIDHFTHE
ncbi:hypothetical protein L873DRAFT_1695810, partial [Choiromyces venosus 120613-1]